MITHASFDESRRSSFVASGFWRIFSWVEVGLQSPAGIVAWWRGSLDGLWIILAFIVGSVVFLLAARRLPSLQAFVVIIAAVINTGGWA